MNSLSLQFKNLQIPDIWEVKDAINKVKNVVFKYTEMEAKVHEATNNEPWGPSSTLMQQIAQATNNYAHFNEIMSTIYKRFSEKEAKQWRQIYKSLILLEYLIKNGSERVVDDTRSHISMIKSMRTFHYIDEKGKDQGINVRNRAKELAGLLDDTEKIRVERKKARLNRNKYQGVGSTQPVYGGISSMEGLDGGGSGSGRRGGGSGLGRISGFGSDSISSSNAGFSSIVASTEYNSSGFSDDYERPNRYQSSKYDDFDDDSDAKSDFGASKTEETSPSRKKAELDLFNFDNDDMQPIRSKQEEKKHSGVDDWGDFTTGTADLDDFDDFQSAPALPSKSVTAAAPSSSSSATQDLLDLLGDDAFVSTPSTPNIATNSRPVSFQNLTPNTPSTPVSQPSLPFSHHNNPPAGNLWSQTAFASLDLMAKQPSNNSPKPSMASMNALKASSNNTWSSVSTVSQNNTSNGNGPAPIRTMTASTAFDDLLSL